MRVRRVLMALSQTAQQALEAMGPIQANSREEVMKGFKSANPDLSEAQLTEIADQWEKNKDVVKDKHQYESQPDLPLKPSIMSNARWNTHSTEEARRSRFEEGVHADPTQNMNPADSKKWKEMHDEHKDNFKSAAVDKELLERYQLEVDTAIEALKFARRTPRNPKKYFFSALHSMGMALGQLEPEGQGPASEAVMHAAQKVNLLRPVTDFAK